MSMDSPWLSLVALAFMLLAVATGTLIRRRWPEHHTNRETIELLQTTVMLLATFAAIVLGLLLTSAKNDFDNIENDVRNFSFTLTQLDYSLAELGAPGDPIRQDLARYTAASIAANWRDEQPPGGAFYPRLQAASAGGLGASTPILGQMLEHINSELNGETATSPQEAANLAAARRLMTIAISQRWHTVEASMGSLSSPFFAVLVFWMAVIYLCFGLSAPFNHVNFMTMVLSALALASAFFVIIDLYTPFSGYLKVDSVPMRAALQEMLSQPAGTPSALPNTGCHPVNGAC
jgi:hypothetical protein